VKPPVDRKKLAELVAHISFTQPDGLVASFVDVALRELLTVVFNQYLQELQEEAIGNF
jgi:hypothetical protein